MDETCVLCENCFNYEAHKDHNYWYTIGTNSSGSCDCGEEDSWRNDLKCSSHSIKPKTDVNTGESSSASVDTLELKEFVGPILDYVMRIFYHYGKKTEPEAHDENCVLILYNDENHSFDDVITVLNSELEIDPETAEEYAHLIDSKVKTLENINIIYHMYQSVI